MSRRALSSLLAAATLAAAGLAAVPQAFAQDFPARMVTIVVPFAPGGVSDILARVLAEKLQVVWKQTVIVDNRPGAGGGLGATQVARSAADGYTLLLADASVVTTNPSLYANAPKDFAPVIALARFGQILVAPVTQALQSVGELLAMDKAASAKLNVASSGNGTSNHLVLEKFKTASGTRMAHVPYKGAGAAISDVAGAQVDLMFTSAPLATPLIASGKIKALAVTTPQRMAGYEKVPTLAESGLAGFEWYSAQGLFAPPGTPAAVVAKINTDVAAVIRQSDVRDRFAKLGIESIDNTPQQFGAWITSETTTIKSLIQAANIKPD